MITFYDSKGKIISANKEFERVLGWTKEDSNAEDILKKSFPDLQKRKEVLKFMQMALPEWREFNLRTKSGKYKYISWCSTKLSDGSYLAIGRDMTDEKKIDQEKREFLSAAAHELKTPITTLKLMCDMIKKRHQIPKTKSKHDFKVIGLELDRLTRLIDDIFDITRFETGKISLRFEVVELKQLLEDVVKKMSYSSRKHTLILDCNEPVEVLVDTHRIEQVLTNLITNAIKFSPPGSEIQIICKKRKKDVLLLVKDQGIGIAKEKQQDIFNRFYQVDDHQSLGMGLGLYISKEIIERHKGRIWVESENGQGSTFCFLLHHFKIKN